LNKTGHTDYYFITYIPLVWMAICAPLVWKEAKSGGKSNPPSQELRLFAHQFDCHIQHKLEDHLRAFASPLMADQRTLSIPNIRP